ncbi:hypothetical protein WR25_18308 [Diploscapter pachys]|uniref:Uncharacterized protein n=1 Tax=Diploscapter pachys TaxID=2018661 RepID=A0A2A2M1X4_9BILA|nr:hypothetical protein WR25_18308 [Diploscapter pachys]
MHRDEAIGRVPQRMIRWERLRRGGIEEGARDRTVGQRRDQRVLIDHVAAGDVDEPRAALHCRELLRPDHRAGRIGRGGGKDDPVVIPDLRRPLIGGKRAVAAGAGDAGDVHAESGETLADQAADRAIADDERARVGQFDAARRDHRPFAAIRHANDLIIALRGGEDAEHGIFGHRNRIDPGAVGDASAPPRGSPVR